MQKMPPCANPPTCSSWLKRKTEGCALSWDARIRTCISRPPVKDSESPGHADIRGEVKDVTDGDMHVARGQGLRQAKRHARTPECLSILPGFASDGPSHGSIAEKLLEASAPCQMNRSQPRAKSTTATSSTPTLQRPEVRGPCKSNSPPG